jgi:fatty acyl-CoA reductase
MKTPNSEPQRSGAPKIGAFFDIDGTLVAAPSLEWRLAMRLAVRGELRVGAATRWLGQILGATMRTQNGEPIRMEMLDRNKAWIGGVDCLCVQHAAGVIANYSPLVPAVLRRMREHAIRGDKIFLVSGTLAPIARALAKRLATVADIEVRATELESKGGMYSGRVIGAAVCGPEKAAAVLRIAARHNLDLAKSYAYANAIGDRWFLEAVGNPVAVAADRGLRKLARDRQWPSLLSAAPEGRGGRDAIGAGEGTLHEY